MNKNRLLQYVSVFDLVAISVWALYHYWGNHGENVPFPGNESVVWTLLWLSWIVLKPIVVYIVLLVRKSLVSARWP